MKTASSSKESKDVTILQFMRKLALCLGEEKKNINERIISKWNKYAQKTSQSDGLTMNCLKKMKKLKKKTQI